jgi:pyruvate dehydrogenase E2 component (dihydrolipoamide acetyltransferase)
MAKDVFIPKFGQTVEEVTLVKFYIQDGEKVEAGQPLLDVETDKAIFTVEAPASGYLHIGEFEEGDVVPVVTVIGVIGKKEDRFQPAVQFTTEKTFGEESAAEEIPIALPRTPSIDDSYVDADGQEMRVFASPRARRAARLKDVDLSRVTPTGSGGIRVTERDVLAYLEQIPKATPLAQKMAAEAGLDLYQVTGTGLGGRVTKSDVQSTIRSPYMPGQKPAPSEEEAVLERVPLKGIRGLIAEHVADSVHTTARVTLWMDVDAAELVALRERLKSRFAQTWGFTPGYNDLLAKICASALKRFSYMNARIAGDTIERLAHCHIGFAVDTDRGLVVPVIRDVDQKSLEQFGKEFRQLIQKAQTGSLLPDEMSGGTFTITNLGMYDVTTFSPVINLPEAAILGVGKLTPTLRLRDGQVAEYPKMVLSLVFDHRIVDGAPAARFLQFIKDMIEDPALLALL